VDATAGVAGDMLLAALLDAGADLQRVTGMIDAVVPGAVRVTLGEVTRAGLRAAKVDVDLVATDVPHRTWRTIRDLLSNSVLPPAVRDNALSVFARLAEAEGRVHGIPAETVHFHEVGALDAIADVVGVCAALHDLAVDRVTGGEAALGSGRVRSAHGVLPVPAPAVIELARGWQVRAGGNGELATPTGMALLTGLSEECAALPPMRVQGIGVGAGTRDTPGAPNVVRVVLGADLGPQAVGEGERMVVLEATVDDLDPRLWPEALSRLLSAGAADAWLTPVVMKKGRPAHVLAVLGRPEQSAALRDVIFRHTTTIGIRQAERQRFALPRLHLAVQVAGHSIGVKIAHRDGVIVRATPEFEDVAACATASAQPLGDVLQQAIAQAAAAGLRPGAPVPPARSTDQGR